MKATQQNLERFRKLFKDYPNLLTVNPSLTIKMADST